jgi:tRNA(Ile2) C34 agmatinyltransferase TiaS
MDILLAGYLTRGEFNRNARAILPGARVFQYNHTRTKNLAVNIVELKPISDLLERVKTWAGNSQ